MTLEPLFKKKIAIEETQINLVSDIDTDNLNNKIETTDIIETDDTVKTVNTMETLEQFITNERNQLKEYIKEHPLFAKTLNPYNLEGKGEKEKENSSEIPEIVKLMINGSQIANVGPTATLAGTIAELSLDYLIKQKSNYSIVDNGGDIAFLNNYSRKKVVFGIYAGNSPFSGKIGLEFKFQKKNQRFGVCTSSASVGYSISYGRSDGVTVIGNQASIADGLASTIGNNVNGKLDKDAVENGLAIAEEYKEHLIGALIIVGESIGTIGKVPRIVAIDNDIILDNYKNK